MNKYTFALYGIALLLILTALFWGFIKKEKSVQTKESIKTAVKTQGNQYKSITSNDLKEMLKNKDFVLIDVHIPEQEHIKETDYFIPYNQVDEIATKIPNKNAKVVLYCRSGSMSKIAAKALVERGYTNVYELKYGLNEWKAQGNPVIPIGSLNK